MLASRFQDLDDFQKSVKIDYADRNGQNTVTLTLKKHESSLTSILVSGINQGDLITAKDSSLNHKAKVVLQSPYSVRIRERLNKCYLLARRRPDYFGPGDIAFYDFAESLQKKITKTSSAFQNYRDSSEKGYINTFNHVTAQMLITIIYDEKTADHIADLHELYHMPELTSGEFSDAQLSDTLNYPVDNYIDMINNEIGQELGKALKRKYEISQTTKWNDEILCNMMNDLVDYYTYSFGNHMERFDPEDELIKKFSQKINMVITDSFNQS